MTEQEAKYFANVRSYIVKLQEENKRLREAGKLLLDAYEEAHALHDLGDCDGSIKMREALKESEDD